MYENWHSGSEIYMEIKNVRKNQDTLKDEQRAIVLLDINIKHNNRFSVLLAENEDKWAERI